MGPVCTFAEWVKLLVADAKRNDKVKNVLCLDEYVLKLFYDEGVDPTCDSIVRSVQTC